MNRLQIRPGLEGIYEVRKSRALHWPSADGKPLIWATAGTFVDLRSAFLCELVQKTGQMHRLTKVESVPKGGVLVTERDAPSVVRDAMRRYDDGKPGRPAIKATPADERKLDVSQLPSAAAPADEPEPEPESEAPAAPPAPAKKKIARKAPGKAPVDPETGSD